MKNREETLRSAAGASIKSSVIQSLTESHGRGDNTALVLSSSVIRAKNFSNDAYDIYVSETPRKGNKTSILQAASHKGSNAVDDWSVDTLDRHINSPPSDGRLRRNAVEIKRKMIFTQDQINIDRDGSSPVVLTNNSPSPHPLLGDEHGDHGGAPQFIPPLPRKLVFSNNSGARLDCRTRPPATVTWLHADSTTVTEVCISVGRDGGREGGWERGRSGREGGSGFVYVYYVDVTYYST